MTTEEAIKVLQSLLPTPIRGDARSTEHMKISIALLMAIKALEREPFISEDGTLIVNVEDGNKVNRVLVCGDNHFGGLYYQE